MHHDSSSKKDFWQLDKTVPVLSDDQEKDFTTRLKSWMDAEQIFEDLMDRDGSPEGQTLGRRCYQAVLQAVRDAALAAQLTGDQRDLIISIFEGDADLNGHGRALGALADLDCYYDHPAWKEI